MNDNSHRHLTDPKRVKAFHNLFIESEAAMRISILLLSFVTTLMIISSCDNSPTGPEEPPPGRRDYIWIVDTLKLPYSEFVTLNGIWGVAPNNIWACGRETSSEFGLWHFDGSKWSNLEIGFGISEARIIFGFSNNNIWLGTAFGIIAEYDGTKWNYVGNFSTQDEFLVIQGIWGTSVNDLYAFGFLDRKDRTGYRGCIMKYDGVNWSYLNIDTLSLNFLSMAYDENAKKYFLHAFRSEDGKQFIYELNESKLTKLYESKEEIKVFNMNNKAYFMMDKKILKYVNGNLSIWKDFSSNSIYAGVLNGRNEKDIFTINWGGIGHFNGNDIAMLYQTDFWFNQSILFDEEVFVLCKNYQTGISAVLHGRLNN